MSQASELAELLERPGYFVVAMLRDETRKIDVELYVRGATAGDSIDAAVAAVQALRFAGHPFEALACNGYRALRPGEPR